MVKARFSEQIDSKIFDNIYKLGRYVVYYYNMLYYKVMNICK